MTPPSKPDQLEVYQKRSPDAKSLPGSFVLKVHYWNHAPPDRKRETILPPPHRLQSLRVRLTRIYFQELPR